MSRVALTSLGSVAGGAVTMSSPVYSPGSVVQTIYARSSARNSYAAAVSGNGTTITDLNLTITPRLATSMLIMQWMINGEAFTGSWDMVYLVHQNGALITAPGFEGYNSQAGNQRWSGVAAGMYDVDNDSTMANIFVQYAIPSRSMTSQTFAPAVRSANATARTFFLNRPAGSAGQDSYEVAVSSGVIWEVAS
jgi:hypothetical protein